MVFDETTKSAPYSLLKDFSQRCPLFYLKKGTAWQDLPLNSFLGEFKSPQTRRSSQNIFSKFTLFLKIKKPQQLGTVGVQPTISELLRFSGATDVTRTHDLLITNQLLYRLSYSSILFISPEQEIYYHTFSQPSTGIFFGRTGGAFTRRCILRFVL